MAKRSETDAGQQEQEGQAFRFDALISHRTLSEGQTSGGGSISAFEGLPCFPPSQAMSHNAREVVQQLTAVVFVGDVIVVIMSLCLTFFVRFRIPIGEFGIATTPDLSDYAGYIVLAGALFLGLLISGDMYNRRNFLRLRLIITGILRWSFCWVGLVLLGTFIVKFQPPISRIYCVMAWIMTPASLVGWRTAVHFIVARATFATALSQRVAFVGWNKETARLISNFQKDPESAYRVIGYLEQPGEQVEQETSVPCLGPLHDFERVLASVRVDVVVLADHGCDRQEILRLANLCEREMVEFKVVPTYFQILISCLHLETIAGVPLMGISRLPLDRLVNRCIKRSMDILGAAVGLVLSVPLIAVFGAIVYGESPGPVFYRQRRRGRNGKPFDIVKIRSMRLDAEKDNRVGWTVENDPRRLKIGAFMRRWNIDEVPQFWNVLKGEMSLIGPRPERPELIDGFKHQIPHYNARHNAKPGITGWAQVNGLRGNTDLHERVKYDLWYLERWSLMLDLQILVMTLLRTQTGAY